MSRERERLLALYGARFEITESLGGMHEAVEAARRMAISDDVFLPDQFSNPANPEAHRRSTGPELWEALDGGVDVLVAGVGTGGTITGVGEYLKQRIPGLHVVAVEPAASAVLAGGATRPAQDSGDRRRLHTGDPEPRDHRRGDRGLAMSRRLRWLSALAAREGVLAGISAGAAVAAARSRSRRATEFARARIAVILPDSGERYVSLPWFAPEAR